ncbi:MAG: glycosyltransferase [Deltaproteobacteria bacterium]|nr:glycosyltransferase [Deltaproteobacteria bacterium]
MSDPRPLAILHVDPERSLGGGEQQVLGLLAQLHAGGHHQTLAADPRGALAPRAAALGIPIAPLAIRSHADVCAARRLARWMARNPCEIVHFHTARAHAMSLFLRVRAETARVATRRMDYPLRGGRYARRLYNREVDAVIAISEGVRAALVASGIDAARIHLVPSGVEAARFAAGPRAAARARLALGDRTWVLAVVGALEERKGHDVLLDALARDPDPGHVVLIAGDGTRAPALRARAAALGLADRVRFLGRVEDVAPLLAAADALVMPSRREGLGVAALEAMAAGLPVVASRVGGLPEAVVDGETGLLVPPGDAAALAAALARLAADPALAGRLGAGGAARAAARFSMAAMAEGTLAVYRRLAAARTKGRA